MKRSLFFSISFALVVLSGCTRPQTADNKNTQVQNTAPTATKADGELLEQIEQISAAAKGKVGVAAAVLETGESILFNGNERFPMQSVYKVPISMAVLKQVDAGMLSLDQDVKIARKDFVSPGQRSPIRDASPNGTALKLRKLIEYAVSESDGTASDVLMDLIGGPKNVQGYIDELGIVQMQVRNSEKEFSKDWKVQFDNWSSPEAAVALLSALHAGEGISPENRDLLLQYMTGSPTGPNRLKGLLPKGTVVAHKTGTSGSRDGVNAATNDIGIITLPNGQHIAVAIFVSDSPETEQVREAVIAEIAKAVWDKWSIESRVENKNTVG